MHRIILICLLLAVNVKCFTQTEFLFDESKIHIELLNLNTDESEFAPYLVGKTLYYASSQERKVGVITMETSTQHQMLDLYQAQLLDDFHSGKGKALSSNINTPLNQAGCYFDKASSKLYYTTDVPCEGCASKHKLAIFSAVLQKDEFLTPIAELILPDTSTAAHPFVYNNRLYFSSNMPGGKGKTDIYYAEKLPEAWDNTKKWGNYKN